MASVTRIATRTAYREALSRPYPDNSICIKSVNGCQGLFESLPNTKNGLPRHGLSTGWLAGKLMEDDGCMLRGVTQH